MGEQTEVKRREVEVRKLGDDLIEIQDFSDSKLSEEESQRATMYPTIPSDQVRKGSSSIWNPKNASSLQKSPILPPNSLDSSRSDTPRTDSSEGDTTSM